MPLRIFSEGYLVNLVYTIDAESKFFLILLPENGGQFGEKT